MPSLFRPKKRMASSSSLAQGDQLGGSQRPRPEQALDRPIADPIVASLPKQKRDLWSEAFESLPQDCREALPSTPESGIPGNAYQTPVEKVIELTQIKYEDYCQRGWHTKTGDTSKETSVRIRAKEIVCSALQFKDIIDAGLKFDPSGYGTIVWSVLSGALTLLQNDKEKIEAVFDSAAVLTRYLPKYAIIENHYRDRRTQELKAFEDQVVHVYAAILKYAACVQKELQRSIGGRLLDSFWTLDNQDVKVLKEDVEAKDKIVSDQSHYVSHEYRKQEFHELESKASDALSKIEMAVKKLLDTERLSTLKWLSDTPVKDRQQQLRTQVEKANKNAGQWLIQSDEFENWLARPGSFAWLHGPSGCGKSSLCSTIIKFLLDIAGDDEDKIVTYWYFDNGDSPTQDLQRLMRHILRVISAKAKPFPEAVRNLAKQHELANTQPSVTALGQALLETVASLEEEIIIVLDAIDEYQADNETARKEFLEFLVCLADAPVKGKHILVSSIPDADIKTAFARVETPWTMFNVEKRVSVDVDAYVDVTVQIYAEDKGWSRTISSEISEVLKTDGRFRIVSLQLEDLRRCYDEREIYDSLKSLPSDIEDAYTRRLLGIPRKDVSRVSHIFYWIAVARRHLTISELVAAPGIDLHSPKELYDICPAGMIREETQAEEPFEIVTFDHPSVKRFLYSQKLSQTTDERIKCFFVSDDAVNAGLLDLMLNRLLNIQQPKLEPLIIEQDPFLLYIAQHWPAHLPIQDDSPGCEGKLKSKVMALFQDPMNPAYLNWMRIWNPVSFKADYQLGPETCPSPLHISLRLGITRLSVKLISNSSYINRVQHDGVTNIDLATLSGNAELVRSLVEAGEKVGHAIDGQRKALTFAVEAGHLEIVRILLDAGANPNEGASDHSPFVLQSASIAGNLEIVKALLASGAKVNLRSGYFGSALQAAAAYGHKETLVTLLDAGAEPDSSSGSLATPIQAAATGGHLDIANILAAKGVEWDEQGDSVWRDAYKVWTIRSPVAREQSDRDLGTSIPSGLTNKQRLLAGVTRILADLPMESTSGSARSAHEDTSSMFDASRRTSQQMLATSVRTYGQSAKTGQYYVYRGLFWSMVYTCVKAVSYTRLPDAENVLSEFVDITIALATDQQIIEHQTSDALMFARDELVELYVQAFQTLLRLKPLLTRNRLKYAARILLKSNRQTLAAQEHLKHFREQVEKYQVPMRTARFQRQFLHDGLSERLQRDVAVTMRQELQKHTTAVEEGVQKSLEGMEQRLMTSMRDILPVIIRAEVQKLLLEQQDEARSKTA